MLTENTVVQLTTDHLKSKGYKILQSLTTSDKGVDIIAEKNGTKLYVEAKGATSSKKNSIRYGKPFTKNQVKTHIAMAILASMKVLEKEQNAKTAIALPDNKDHRDLVSKIENVLEKMGIEVVWVK